MTTIVLAREYKKRGLRARRSLRCASTRQSRPILLVVALLAFASAASALAAVKPGTYAGTTSEKGTVAFTVTGGGKSISGFATSDGYNGKCHFHGGAGGMANFSISIPTIPIATNGAFAGTAKAKLGPFSGTFQVKGKVEGRKASGTIDQVGSTCGKGSQDPSVHDYLETFQASAAG
jgi:hypothetical protein